MPALDLSTAQKKLTDAKLELDQARAALASVQSSQEFDRIKLAKKPLVIQVEELARQFKDSTEELQANIDDLKVTYSKFYKQRTIRSKAKNELVQLNKLEVEYKTLITSSTQKETDVTAKAREQRDKAKVHLDAGKPAEAAPHITEAEKLEKNILAIQAGITAAHTNLTKVTDNIAREQIKLNNAKTALDTLKLAQPTKATEFNERIKPVKALKVTYDELKSKIDTLNTDIAKYDNELNSLTKPATDLIAEKEEKYREAERLVNLDLDQIKKSRLHRIYNYALAESLLADADIDFEFTDKDIDSINLYLHTKKEKDLTPNAKRIEKHFTEPEVEKLQKFNKELLANIYSSYDFNQGKDKQFIPKPQRLFYANLARNNEASKYRGTHIIFQKTFVKAINNTHDGDVEAFKKRVISLLPVGFPVDNLDFSDNDFEVFQLAITNYQAATTQLLSEKVNPLGSAVAKEFANIQKKSKKLIDNFTAYEKTPISSALDPRLHRTSWAAASKLQPYYEKLDKICQQIEKDLDKVIVELEQQLASHPAAHQTEAYISTFRGPAEIERVIDFKDELRKERITTESTLKEAKKSLASVKTIQLKLHGDDKAIKGSKEALGLLGQCELTLQKVGVTLSKSKMKTKDYDNIEHYTAAYSHDTAPHKPKVLKLGAADEKLPISADKPIPKGKIRGFSKTYENSDGSREPGSFAYIPPKDYRSITYNKSGNGFKKGDKVYVAMGDERIEFHQIPPISNNETIPSSTMQFMMDGAIKYFTNGAELSETSLSKLKPFQRRTSITGGSYEEQEAIYIATLLLKQVLGQPKTDIVVDSASSFKPSSLYFLGKEGAKIKAFKRDPAVKAKLEEVRMWKKTQNHYLNKDSLKMVKKLEKSSVLSEPSSSSSPTF